MTSSRSSRDAYEYPRLRAYEAISVVLSVLVIIAGVWLAFEAMRNAASDTEAVVGGAVIGLVTALVAITVGLAADVVRWMHDIVNLLDEHSEYLHEIEERPRDRTS